MTLLIEGDVPIVSAKNNNNGYKMFVDAEGQKIFKGNFLTINNNGDGGAGIAYYQPADVLLDNHVTALYPKIEMSRETMLFISRSITIQREKFGYGYTLSNKRLNIFRLMLPVTEDGLPDFDYMENYVRAIENKILQGYREYITKLNTVGGGVTVPPLNEKIWRSFFISDVAEILSGRDIYEDEREVGNNPYIGSSSRNNGVCHFVSNENETLESNCISVNRNGSVGYAFFHPYAALYSNDCRKLRPRVPNEFVSLFIANQITAQRGKYNYGYKMGTERLKRQKIQLPVTEDSLPDFEYMAAYVKNLMAAQYRKYLEYIDGE